MQGEVDVPEDIDGDDETILSIRYSEYAVDKYGVITATKTVAIEKPVTDEDGDPLLDGEGNPITTVVNETSVVQVGRLVLATFDNSAGLEKIGQSYQRVG